MPHYIEMIQDKNGKIIYRRDDSICKNCENYESERINFPEVTIKQRKRLIDPRVAYQMNSILKGAAVRGTSSRIAKYKLPIASKTGTTNQSFDAWTIAYTPSMIVGGYVGYDHPADLGKRESGATVMLPIIDLYLSKIIDKIDKSDFIKPDGIELVMIDPHSGAISDGPGSIEEAIAPGFINNTSGNNDSSKPEDSERGEIILDESIFDQEEGGIFEDTGEVY
ncbi:MAG: hypothetical protein EB127_10625 [Alphaproteobacteria bacterium]|nr:hypothetical protein [Alphaproteobacteria bacterium]